MEETLERAVRKLEEQIGKFELLKTNESLFPKSSLLFSASKIKSNTLDDSDISSAAQADADFADRCQSFLDQVTAYQERIMTESTQRPDWDTDLSYRYVKDFPTAKRELIALVEKEIPKKEKFINLDADVLLKVPDLDTHFKTLEQVHSDCSDKDYEILLIGEYQSGKTTTMNALCGGRYIGAIGNGTTTSAVPVSVSYAEEESVAVIWQPTEVLSAILSHLGQHFDDFKDDFDLEDPESRSTWLQRTDAFREEKECPRVGDPEFRYLALCTLILKYYGTPELESMMNRSYCSSDISWLTRFPNSLEQRWNAQGSVGFTIDESLFVFINRIQCRYPFENLRVLHATVVDCPGLFSSSYDTEITERLMTRADAIVYILPYEKQIGMQVCESLYRIKEKYPDFHRKLVLVNNCSVLKEGASISANEAIARSLFGPDILFIPMDARLSFLSEIKSAYDKGQLPKMEQDLFVKNTKPIRRLLSADKSLAFSGFVEAWRYQFRLYQLEYEGYSAIDYLEESGFCIFLKELGAFIEKNGAYSLICSNGVLKLADELTGIRDRIQLRYIEPYKKGMENRTELWEQRLSRARSFNDTLLDMVDKHFYGRRGNGASMVQDLSGSVYQKMFSPDEYYLMFKEICGVIYDNKRILFKYRKKKDQERLKEFLTPQIQKVITPTIERRFSHWNSLMVSGQETAFSGRFISEMSTLRLLLENKWKEVYSDDDAFKELMGNYVSIPKDTKDFDLKAREQVDAKDIPVGGEPLAGAMFADFSATVASVAMAIAGYVCFLIINIMIGAGTVIANPVGLVLAMVSLPITGFWIYIGGRDKIRSEFIKRMIPKIQQKIEEERIYIEFKKLVDNEVHARFGGLEKTMEVDLKKMQKDRDFATRIPEESLEENCFKGIEMTAMVNAQMKEYKEFADKNLSYD